jgi:Spy/CpxP family protein refolding chaperone
MKINKWLPLFLFLITLNGFAQSRLKEKKEQIRALKIAFITDELKLTTDEATKFWPLYNNFEEKQRELKQQKIRSYMKRFESNEVEKMSEKEATTLLNQMENTEDEMYQLRKKFVSNLRDVLPPVKIIKLKKVEEDFNRKLLKQYRDQGIPK